VGKCERIGHRQRWYVEQSVNEEAQEEGPERGAIGGSEQRDAADEVAKRKEFFRREIAIGKLIAKKDPDERRDTEHASCQGLLPGFKVQSGGTHEGKDFDLPSTPNGDLEDHHDEELGNCGRIGFRSGYVSRHGWIGPLTVEGSCG